MASIWNWSPTAASNANADSGFTQAEGMAAAQVNDAGRGMMARMAALLAALGGAGTYGGAANAYTVTSPTGNALSAYVNGLLVALVPNADNSGAVTVNVDALGAKAVKKPNGAALASGDLVLNGKYLLSYNSGLGYFQVLGSMAGGDFQPADTTLTGLAALSIVAGSVPYGAGADTWSVASSTATGRSLWNIADAAAGQTILALVPGTNVQAYSAKLLALAAQTWAADSISYQTGTGAVAETTLSAYGRTLIDDADAATARTTLGVVIGTNVQAFAANLTTYAGVAPSANAQTLLGHTFAQMRTDLSLGTIYSFDETTTAQYWANTAGKALSTDKVWAAAAPVALTDAATIAVDFSTGINFKVTLAGNRTMGQPSNVKKGQSGVFEITQDGTGTRTLAWHADYLWAGGTDGVLSTAAGSKDRVSYYIDDNSKTNCSILKAMA